MFISGGNSQQVEETGNSVRNILERVLPKTRVVSLADRDDKSPEEVARSDGLTLSKRNVESYLLAEDVIGALVSQEGKYDLLAEAHRVRENALRSSIARGNRPDDLKSAAGEIYNGLVDLLDLKHPGQQ